MKQLISIEERAINLAQYIIDSKDTVRGAAKKFGISKSTVHTEVTLRNGSKTGQVIPESIEIRKVFLAEKNPVVILGLVIK
ncbi:MAG: sporulation transcriptional regulator SpoIIID [Clostridia bacterium]|nr:sporulation transcriptional regulator SpoIIID [Clostridia bacterium]